MERNPSFFIQFYYHSLLIKKISSSASIHTGFRKTISVIQATCCIQFFINSNVYRSSIDTIVNVSELCEQRDAMGVRSFHLFVIVLILGGLPLVSADSLCSDHLCNTLEESEKEDTLVQHGTCSQDSLSDFGSDENCLIQSTLNTASHSFIFYLILLQVS